jgi:hypothetical protein
MILLSPNERLRETHFCFGIPFQFIGRDLAILLFKIIDLGLLCIAPEIRISIKPNLPNFQPFFTQSAPNTVVITQIGHL